MKGVFQQLIFNVNIRLCIFIGYIFILLEK